MPCSRPSRRPRPAAPEATPLLLVARGKPVLEGSLTLSRLDPAGSFPSVSCLMVTRSSRLASDPIPADCREPILASAPPRIPLASGWWPGFVPRAARWWSRAAFPDR